MRQPPNDQLLNKDIRTRLEVSGLISGLLEQLGIATIGDLIAVNISEAAKRKGIGAGKIAALQELIKDARGLVGIGSDENSGREYVEASSEFDELSRLLYVPGLIKSGIERLGLVTIRDLIELKEKDLSVLPSWGDKKTQTVLALRNLYLALFFNETCSVDRHVSKILDPVIAPDPRICDLPIRAILDGSVGFELAGRPAADLRELRTLLASRFAIHTTESSLSHLDWREVPLQVNSRVSSFLAEFGIDTIGQIEAFLRDGTVADPETGDRIPIDRVPQFGETSLDNLNSALNRMKTLGLAPYRGRIVCSLEQLDCPEMHWRDVPLKINSRVKKFLADKKIDSIKQVHSLALRTQYFCEATGRWFDAGEADNFSDGSLKNLRAELKRLAKSGLATYRFGEAGPPQSIEKFIERTRSKLSEREFELLAARFGGATLEQTAESFGITRERVRQIARSALAKLDVFRDCCRNWLEPIRAKLGACTFVATTEAIEILQIKTGWHFWLAIQVAGYPWSKTGTAEISGLPKEVLKALPDLLRKLVELVGVSEMRGCRTIQDLCALADAHELLPKKVDKALRSNAELALADDFAMVLISKEWIMNSIRAQLVASGVNGLHFSEIDTLGAVDSPGELEELLGGQAIKLADGRFRRTGIVYRRADELIEIVEGAGIPVDVEYIQKKSSQSWHRPILVGNYLSKIHEIITTDRGKYIHIGLLGLSSDDIKQICRWGADLLAGEKRTVDGDDLFDLFQSSEYAGKLENSYQLVSVISKHPDVRRLSNNLQIAHRDSFDESELSLEKVDPEIAAQWHSSKNGTVTPADVRPNSFKSRWWQCEMGHEFEAMPVYRTRITRACPGCRCIGSAERDVGV